MIEIQSEPEGFTCIAKVGDWVSPPVKVSIDKVRQEILVEGRGWTPILASRAIIEKITRQLYSTYQPTKFKQSLTKKSHQLDKIKISVAKKQAKFYSKKIAAELNRLRSGVDQEWLAVHRKCFATVGPKNYTTIIGRILYKYNELGEYKKFFLNDAKNYGTFHYEMKNDSASWTPDWLERLLSGSNVIAKKALSNLPGALIYPDDRNQDFHNVNFHKIPNRTELKLWMTIREFCYNFSSKLYDKNDIKKAAQLYSKNHGNEDMDLRKRNTFFTLATYIRDYPQYAQHTGSLTGLIRKSIEWHKQAQYNQATSGMSPDTPTFPIPPFLAKELEGRDDVKFLATVGEVATEGNNMHHCVASYAKYAVEGRSFLFHIEKYNEKATVELNKVPKRPDGNMFVVAQCRGPCNINNKAAKWVDKFFKKIFSREYGLQLGKTEEANLQGQAANAIVVDDRQEELLAF